MRDTSLGITEIEGGFPHSEILGSKLVRSSPRLIAAYHVLHRLSAPRHPPNALMTLDCSHYRRPPSPHPLGRGADESPIAEGQDDDRKDHFLLRTHPRALRSSGAHCDNRLSDVTPVRRLKLLNGTDQDRMRFLFTMLDNPPDLLAKKPQRNSFPLRTIRRRSAVWWSQTGSNRRPHACKARALPTELWPHRRDRYSGSSALANCFA